MILLSVLLKPGVALGHFHEVGLRGLRSRSHVKIVWRWMRRQKLRLIFNHVGSQKQFLVLGMTWFTEPNFKQQAKPVNDYPQHKSP
ncbi:unnamed protein product [Prunus armeniaca]|uniref:Uncharacterized protein n=1 Tax=Prunus armeniaca TaxID=36596 RepID=A0A6J5VK10_PRUAR|nr:unnamed protein product [Prunus armeniaca]